MKSLLLLNKVLLLCLLSVFLVSCGKGSSSDDETTSSNIVGPSGGLVSFAEAKISLNIPANALTSDVEFSVTSPSSYPTGAVANTVFDITPDNLSFLTSVDLTIHYDESDLPTGFNEADLWLAKQVGDQWIELANYSKDSAANTLTGQLDSLSVYAIIATVNAGTGTEIGSAGGTVNSVDNKVSIDFPQDALTETKNITINLLSTYPTGVLADSVYNFGPEGLSFTKPVEVTLYYDENALPQGVDESQLWVAELSEGRWFKVPGSSVDTNNNLVKTTVNGFSTYGIGYGSDLGTISLEAYVVDTPAADNEFDTIAAAIDYLNTNLEASETGKLVLKTDRQLTISTLDFQRAIVMAIADGNNPGIVGPGTSPIIINGAGSIGMSGWSIANEGGLQLNTYGSLDLNNNTLPATAITLGGDFGNSSKPLAHRKLSSRENGVFGDSWSIGNNTVQGPLSFFAATGLKGQLDLTNNTAPRVNMDGYALASAKMQVSGNVVDDIFIHFTLANLAYLKVSNHANLNDLNMDLN
ncbi:MAG: hypothetical protein R3240_09850, partial [Gammaproteobacteria bacterium]|nr:hypothetical protein [Gammaproteobacteria bacterium]